MSELVQNSTSSERGYAMLRYGVLSVSLIGSLVGLLVVGCGGNRSAENEAQSTGEEIRQVWDRSAAELEYRLLQAEMSLAKSDSVYLVLDLKANRLQLKLESAVVWSHGLEPASDGMEDVADFCSRFQSGEGRLVRPIVEKYLFEASNKTPDSLLAIVSGAVAVNPELLQRHVPGRFQVLFGEGLILDIRADVPGTPVDKFQNTVKDLRQALRRSLGDAIISLKLEPDEAVTLFRAVNPGMVALLNPPR